MKNPVKKRVAFHCWYIFLFFSCSYREMKMEAPQVNNLETNVKYRINLPEEHSSGYIWQLSETYDKKIIDNINTVWHGNTKGVDFNFHTLAAGQTTLTFILRKYTDTSAIKHFIVKIREK